MSHCIKNALTAHVLKKNHLLICKNQKSSLISLKLNFFSMTYAKMTKPCKSKLTQETQKAYASKLYRLMKHKSCKFHDAK